MIFWFFKRICWFFAYLESSHGFLSMLFGFLGKFRIGIVFIFLNIFLKIKNSQQKKSKIFFWKFENFEKIKIFKIEFSMKISKFSKMLKNFFESIFGKKCWKMFNLDFFLKIFFCYVDPKFSQESKNHTYKIVQWV